MSRQISVWRGFPSKALNAMQACLRRNLHSPGGAIGASSANSASSSTSAVSGKVGAGSVTTAMYAPPTLVSDVHTATAYSAKTTEVRAVTDCVKCDSLMLCSEGLDRHGIAPPRKELSCIAATFHLVTLCLWWHGTLQAG